MSQKPKLLIIGTIDEFLYVKTADSYIRNSFPNSKIEVMTFPVLHTPEGMRFFYRNQSNEDVEMYHQWLAEAILECDYAVTVGSVDMSDEYPYSVIKYLIEADKLMAKTMNWYGRDVQCLIDDVRKDWENK